MDFAAFEQQVHDAAQHPEHIHSIGTAIWRTRSLSHSPSFAFALISNLIKTRYANQSAPILHILYLVSTVLDLESSGPREIDMFICSEHLAHWFMQGYAPHETRYFKLLDIWCSKQYLYHADIAKIKSFLSTSSSSSSSSSFQKTNKRNYEEFSNTPHQSYTEKRDPNHENKHLVLPALNPPSSLPNKNHALFLVDYLQSVLFQFNVVPPPHIQHLLSNSMQPITKEKEAKIISIDEMRFDNWDLRDLHPGALLLLYDEFATICKTCGRRFSKSKKDHELFSAHLDWHFKMKRVQQIKDQQKTRSTSWFLDEQEWVDLEDVVFHRLTHKPGEEQEKEQKQKEEEEKEEKERETKKRKQQDDVFSFPLSALFSSFASSSSSSSSSSSCSRTPYFYSDKNAQQDQQGVPIAHALESEQSCFLCLEKFVQEWDDDESAWQIKNAFKIERDRFICNREKAIYKADTQKMIHQQHDGQYCHCACYDACLS